MNNIIQDHFYENKKIISSNFTEEEYINQVSKCINFIDQNNIEINEWISLFHRTHELLLAHNPYFYTYPDLKIASKKIKRMNKLYKYIVYIESYPQHSIKKDELWAYFMFLKIYKNMFSNINIIARKWIEFTLVDSWLKRNEGTLNQLTKSKTKQQQVENVIAFVKDIIELLSPLWEKNHFGVHQKQKYIDETQKLFHHYNVSPEENKANIIAHFNQYFVPEATWIKIFKRVNDFQLIKSFPISVYQKDIHFATLVGLNFYFKNYDLLHWWFVSLLNKKSFKKMYPYIINNLISNNKFLIQNFKKYSLLFMDGFKTETLIKLIQTKK